MRVLALLMFGVGALAGLAFLYPPIGYGSVFGDRPVLEPNFLTRNLELILLTISAVALLAGSILMVFALNAPDDSSGD